MWPSVKAGAFYFALLNSLFFSALWGDRTLLVAATDSPSILPRGAFSSGPPRTYYRLRDRAPSWQYEPELAVTHRMIFDNHEMPWWNPYQGFGTPWAAGMIQQPFYPLTLLASMHPSPRVMSWFVVLRLFIAGLLGYGFLRYFLGPMPSTIGGLAFMLAGYFIINLNLDNISTDILVPLILITFEQMIRSNSFRAFLAAIASMWLLLISGMPESAAVILAFGYAYFLFRAFVEKENRADALRLAGRLVLATVLAFALSAFLILPMVEFLRAGSDSHRAALYGLGAVHVNRSILVYVLPLIAGPLYSGRFFASGAVIFGYYGVGCCVLALTAVFSAFRCLKRDRNIILFFGAALAFGFAKYFGFVLVNWIGYLPVWRLVNFPQYLQPVLAFCIAALSAYGADQLIKGRVRFEMLLAVLVPCVLTGIYAGKFGSLINAPGDLHQFYFYSLAIGLVMAESLLVIAVFAFLRGASVKPRIAFSILLVLLTFELSLSYVYPIYNYSQRLPLITADPFKGAPYIDFLKNKGIGYDRVFGHDELLPAWASVFQIFDSRYNSAIAPGKLFPFGRKFFDGQQNVGSGELVDRFTGEGLPYSFSSARERRFLQLSSTRFVLTPKRLGPPFSDVLIKEALKQNGPAAQKDAGRFRAVEFTIDGDSRPVLFEHPPMSRIVLQTNIAAANPVLKFSPAINPALFGSACGDGVSFLLEMATPEGTIVPLYSRYIDPKHNLAEQHWINEKIDLSKFAGQDVKLLLSTGGGPKNDYGCDWAGWGGLSFGGADESDVPDLKLVYDAETKIYEYAHPLPRASWYSSAKVVSREEDALQTVGDTNVDVTREAVVVNAPLPPQENELLQRVERADRQPVTAAQIVKFTFESVGIRTNSASDGMLMLTDSFFPGWNVYVDNHKRTVLQTDYIFRGVLVEKGSHLVEFRYEDSAVRLGSSVSLAALFGTGAIGYFRRRSVPQAC